MTVMATRYEVKGTTTDVTQCQLCRLEDLRKTIVLAVLDSNGNQTDLTYAGTECAAKATGRTVHDIRSAARAADATTGGVIDPAARQARVLDLGGVYTVTVGRQTRRGLSATGIHNQAAALKRQAYGEPITVADAAGAEVTSLFPELTTH